jgi:hypothetical protein
LANPEVIPPKAAPFDIPDIAYLKRLYRDDWKDAAIHYGLIDPDSPEEEIEDELEPVASLEVATKPIADSDNPQEPTPSTPAIGPEVRQQIQRWAETTPGVVMTPKGPALPDEVGKKEKDCDNF